MSEQQNTPVIYVGYLPLPPGYRRFAVTAVALLAGAAVLAAAVLANQQQSTGDAVWEYGDYREVTGVLREHPYPMLEVSAADGRQAIHLLVQEFKYGAQEPAKGLHGRRVKVTASRLERAGRKMLELKAGASIVPTGPRAELLEAQPGGAVTIRGEIIDPKCYLGAMKPGGGKVHRACAVLCLKGGIAPMFVTRTAEKRETFYVLTDARGDPILDPLLPHVGLPVELSGERVTYGELVELRVDPASIRRLAGSND